jgi:hypothetical protein
MATFSNAETEVLLAKWAARITAAWRESVQGIIGVGDLLVEAREDLKPFRGEWSRLIGDNGQQSKLPFSAGTAKRLIAIAEDPRIRSHVNVLPAAWGTLYELSTLTDLQFEHGLANGLVRPEMERADTHILRAKEKPKRIERPANLEVRSVRIMVGDALTRLRELPDECAHTCITSPPYWNLRDYEVEGQIGLEATPEEYIAKLVGVFGQVRRVLRADGTLWVVISDTYAGRSTPGEWAPERGNKQETLTSGITKRLPPGMKNKDLCLIPFELAKALRNDGWYVRADIIWKKGRQGFESVSDRPTRNHEYVWLLSKSEQY